MRRLFEFVSIAAGVASLALLGAVPAAAKCATLSFSVNDYGKDGPTKDAKELLDKYIAKWAKEKGIGQYTVGKKDVSCELFLDFVVFDEHTCKATARVCWSDAGPAVAPALKSPSPVARPPTPAPAVRSKSATAEQ